MLQINKNETRSIHQNYEPILVYFLQLYSVTDSELHITFSQLLRIFILPCKYY